MANEPDKIIYSMIRVSKYYDKKPILTDISLSYFYGAKIGVLGLNGSGKSSLLRILAGVDQDFQGQTVLAPGLTVGYLAQEPELDETKTVREIVSEAVQETVNLMAEFEEVNAKFAEPMSDEEMDKLITRQAEIQEKLDHLNAWDLDSRLDMAMDALRCPPPDTPVKIVSGGERRRVALCRLLLQSPDILLLDEPTNHLDFDMLSWMEDWLIGFKGGALVVSHDRVFLDRAATAILEIDPMTHTARMFAGSYSAYLETKAAERERQWQDFRDQQDEIIRLRAAAARVRSRAKFHAGGKADPAMTDGLSAGFFANRGKETVARAKSIEKRVEHLLTDERVEKPGRTWQMKVEFAGAPSGRDVLAAENLSVGYGEHVLLSGLDLNLRLGERAALVGPNGSGKTTLLRTIAGELPPLTGRLRLGAGVQTGYMAQEQETFDPALNVLDTLSAVAPQNETTMRTFLSKYLFTGDEVFVPVGRLSFGERARLSLACLVAQGCNLLLLDEPLNHLDIPARTRFEHALSSFQGTVLVVAHDRYFIAAFARTQWEVRGGRVFADPA